MKAIRRNSLLQNVSGILCTSRVRGSSSPLRNNQSNNSSNPSSTQISQSVTTGSSCSMSSAGCLVKARMPLSNCAGRAEPIPMTSSPSKSHDPGTRRSWKTCASHFLMPSHSTILLLSSIISSTWTKMKKRPTY